MKSNLIILSAFFLLSFASCKKIESLKKASVSSSDGLPIPVGFKWQNSRNIDFSVHVTDVRFGNSMFLISIYDGNPSQGGKLLSKGSATSKNDFSSKIYLSTQVSSVYIVKTSADNSTAMLKVPVGSSAIAASIGN